MDPSKISGSNQDPEQNGIIRPSDIVTAADYWKYTSQRLGTDIENVPTVRVPYPALFSVMEMVLRLLRDDRKAYDQLQVFEVEHGDHLFTSDFDRPDSGDGAAAYFQACASTKDQKLFAEGFANTVKKLHVLHHQWCDAGRPIRVRDRA